MVEERYVALVFRLAGASVLGRRWQPPVATAPLPPAAAVLVMALSRLKHGFESRWSHHPKTTWFLNLTRRSRQEPRTSDTPKSPISPPAGHQRPPAFLALVPASAVSLAARSSATRHCS